MSYEHERYTSREKKTAFNTVWPAVASGETADNELRRYLRSRRLDFETAYLAGWYPALFNDCLRVVIPCKSLNPEHAYYQARALNKSTRLRYVSPLGPRLGALCIVDPVLSDLDETLSPSVTAIVEGPMCALALASLGIPSIALMGIRPDTQACLHLVSLLKSRRHDAAILFDNEDEAQAEASNLAVFLAGNGIINHVFSLKSKDVADSSDKERKRIAGDILQWQRKSR